MAQQLLQVIQQQQVLQTPSGIDIRPIEVPACTQQQGTQPDLIILKSDNVEEDEGEGLLDVMSQGIIPDAKDDEENKGQIKPEEDALLD